MNRILVIAAHPDDEVLGCGATMAKFADQGDEVYTAILGEGVTSRDDSRDRSLRKNELSELNHEVLDANKKLGVKEVFTYDLPDNRFDSVPLIEIIKIVEKLKNDLQPNIIFTHYKNDLNIDHQKTYEAVLTATRPMQDEMIKEIYSFEVLSSTEWNFPLSYSPDVFIDVSKTIEKKLEAMKVYKNELREFPHPRSLEGIELNAKHWGMRMGCKYLEAFKSIRVIR